MSSGDSSPRSTAPPARPPPRFRRFGMTEHYAFVSACEKCRLESRAAIGESSVSESVINVSDLTRRFGAKAALSSVSLSVPRGGVYGLVGANGAGKTTLIRHILGLLRTESGSVRVFGLDPVAD